MDVYEWASLGWGIILAAGGLLLTPRWPITAYAYGTWTCIGALALTGRIWDAYDDTINTLAPTFVCAGVIVAAVVYALRLRRERDRVGKVMAERWARDSARRRAELEEALADLMRRDDEDETLPPADDRRWAEGGM